MLSYRTQLVALVAVVLACILLLLWIGASAPSPPGPSTIQPQDNAQPAKKDAQPQANQNPFSAFWRWITHDATTFFTVGIFVFTAVLAFSTIGLWIATRRIADVQQRDTRIIQRAHLWVEIGSIRALTNAPGFVPRIVIRNAGRMPAKKVGWVFGEPHFTTNNEWKPSGDPGVPRGEVTLAPGAEMTHGAQTLHVQRDQVPSKTYLYIWGYVRYDDGFEDGRITQFCHRYNMDRLWWDKERTGLRVFAKQYGRYNRYYNDAT